MRRPDALSRRFLGTRGRPRRGHPGLRAELGSSLDGTRRTDGGRVTQWPSLGGVRAFTDVRGAGSIRSPEAARHTAPVGRARALAFGAGALGRGTPSAAVAKAVFVLASFRKAMMRKAIRTTAGTWLLLLLPSLGCDERTSMDAGVGVDAAAPRTDGGARADGGASDGGRRPDAARGNDGGPDSDGGGSPADGGECREVYLDADGDGYSPGTTAVVCCVEPPPEDCV